MFRPTGLGVVGQGLHRSGWPYVMQALAPWMSDEAPVLLDDNVERTFFLGGKSGIVHRTPWIGICHHPVKAPQRWILGLERLGERRAWRESLPHLKLVIVLAEHAAPKLREMWGVPCLALRHPTEAPALEWSPEAFRSNPSRKLVQVGFHLRNPRAIFQVRAPAWLEKARLVPGDQWNAGEMTQRWRQVFADRPDVGEVTEIERLDADAYDRLLAENVVFMELLRAMANNTIVECIARSTPIVVNRMPGPEFYLGRDYPLFYDDIGEVEALLTPERILEAHAYLKRLPKHWLSGEAFATALALACRKTVPELWTET
ncbi:MAG TPA: hypothetical protein VIJ94_07210 [Caulobacteraceae bacterium]